MKVGLILATNEVDYLNFLVPRGIGALAVYINRELPHIEVKMSENLDTLLDWSPDLIGISSTTECYYIAIDMAKRIKAYLGIPVVIGGPHTSLLPQSLDPIFDLGVKGEGEITFAEVVKSIEDNNGINNDSLALIQGIHYHQDGKVICTEPRPSIQDLDSLPTIKIDQLPYYREGQRGLIFSARGCPYKCSFCASTQLFKKYRANSIDYIVNEMDDMINRLNVPSIMFFDDLLIARKERIEELYRKLKERDLIKVPLYCQVRANLIDDYICDLLSKMNFVEVSLGIESFCDRTLKYYNKAGVNGAINQRAIDCLHAHGIRVNGSYIFGAPDETKEEMQITFRSLYHNFEKKKINDPSWGILRPMPGTKVWDDAKEMGIVDDNMCWHKLRTWSTFETYMNTHVSVDDFIALLHEWLTKYTLLKIRDTPIEELRGQMFFISDRQELDNNIQRFAKIIEERQTNQGIFEEGDDLVLEAYSPHNADSFFDEVSQHVSLAAASSSYAEFKELNKDKTFRYRMLSKDPYSLEFKNEVVALYERIAQVEYNVNNEIEDASNLVNVWPWASSDFSMVERHFSMLAQLFNALQRVFGSFTPPIKVVEYGPGYGHIAESLALLHHHVTVVDISQSFLNRITEICLANKLHVDVALSSFEEYIPADDFRFDVAIFNSSFHHCLNFQDLLQTLNEKVLQEYGTLIFLQEPIFDDLEHPWGLSTGGEAVWAISRNKWLELAFRRDFFASLLLKYGFFTSELPAIGQAMKGFIGYKKRILLSKWFLPATISDTWHYATTTEEYRFSKGTSHFPNLKGCSFKKYQITVHNFAKTQMPVDIIAGNTKESILLDPCEARKVIIDADCDGIILLCCQTYIPDLVYQNGDRRELGIAVSEVCLL